MQQSDNISPQAPSLPKGGGALTGLAGQAGAAGPDGAASLSLPLPVSAGRGYAPSLSLSYSSQAGNGAFGIGWDVNLPAVSRRTRKVCLLIPVRMSFLILPVKSRWLSPALRINARPCWV